MENKVFKCEKCGICCTKLNLSDAYADLDDGTGVCKYFDTQTRLCTIYVNRPEKCDVIAMYKYFEKITTFEQYIKMNEENCKRLRGM